MPIPTVDSRQRPEPGRAIAGTPAEIKDIVAQYEAIGVNEIIVTDAVFGRITTRRSPPWTCSCAR